MLISQRFRKPGAWEREMIPSFRALMNQLRVDIFNAVKYAIPDYFTPAESYEDIGEEDISRGAEEFRIDLEQCDAIAKMVKRFNDFQYFARLPFDSIFIENGCFGALVQRRGENRTG